MTLDLFGTPEPIREEPRIFSVTEVTRAVRRAIETEVGSVWVEGEVSNYRQQASGHQYFTLKDAQAQLPCVWFARPGLRLRQVSLADGMQVQVRGAMTVYEARGQYQLNVQLVQAAGAGLLQARFEALKRKLEAEGLFAAERKKPLPAFPSAIAIVTSRTGAALRDMLSILARRAPWVRVLICPARVQGTGAAGEIAAAIRDVNRFVEQGQLSVQVLVVCRGGGSAEDLWEFNEEAVARAIAASAIPVVSAVGHEIDFTIADFVADLRAPTPSAAAELIVPDTAAVLRRIAQLRVQAARLAAQAMTRAKLRLQVVTKNALIRAPRQRLTGCAQRVDLAAEALQRGLRRRLDQARQRVAELHAIVRQHRPDQLLALRRQRLSTVRARLAERVARALEERSARLERLEKMLRALAPDATLARGYSITTTREGRLVDSVSKAKTGATIITRVKDGRLHSQVLHAEPAPRE